MGYDIERFHASDINEEFICPICQDVLQNPVLIDTCQHIFCFECINKWLESSLEKVCPNDREVINTEKSLRPPDRPFCNILKNLLITCDFCVYGCDERIKIELLEHHVLQCLFNPKCLDEEVSCSADCGAKFKRCQSKEHNCVDYLKQMITHKDAQITEFELKITHLTDELKTEREKTQNLKHEISELKTELNLIINDDTKDVINDDNVNVPIANLIDLPIECETKLNTEIIDNKSDDIENVENERKLSSASFNGNTSEENRKMIDALCAKGFLYKLRVIETMLTVDRAHFSPVAAASYVLHHVRSIGYGAHSGPLVFEAKLLQYLEPHLPISNYNGDFKVLNIGSGSGYLTACIAVMGSHNNSFKVIGIDHIQPFIELANDIIQRNMPQLFQSEILKFVTADGRFGYAIEAPYDLIFVEPHSKRIPQKLIFQLKPGGKMIMPIGSKEKDINLELITKQNNGDVIRQIISDDWKMREYAIDCLDEKKYQLRSGWKVKLGF